MNRWNEMTNTECSDCWVPVGRSMKLCICVFICRVWVVVLYVLPPRFSPLLQSHLPVGECGVPHALPCVPTPWLMLSDMTNVNRCCARTGSGRLLRVLWKRSCSSPWQRTVRGHSTAGNSKEYVPGEWGCVGWGWGLKRLYLQFLTPWSGLNSWLHLVELYGSNLTDPQYHPDCKSMAEHGAHI